MTNMLNILNPRALALSVKMVPMLVLSLQVLLASACMSDQPPGSEEAVETGEDVVPAAASVQEDTTSYAFDEPDVSFVLPEALREISGLTVLPNGRLGAVQDEEGLLYMLSGETGAIEATHSFGETGDYEGIALAGDRVYILRSDGTLIAISDWSGEAPQVRTYETGLKGKNDTEGLAYDAAGSRLLIACKEEPGSGLDEHQKAIYAFDLEKGILQEEPAYVVDVEALDRRVKGTFKPSALAVHPSTGEVYVLSATAKALAVLGVDGSMKRLWELPRDAFEQPEGLAFLADGTLYISSEGDDGPAMLYRFSYRSQG